MRAKWIVKKGGLREGKWYIILEKGYFWLEKSK
jgi:hypothetical protein